MGRHIKKFINNYLPIMVIASIIISLAGLSIGIVYAGNGGFKTSNTNWSWVTNDVAGANSATYPYSEISDTEDLSGSGTSKIYAKYVSMDVLYGTNRNLVYYHGELPYKQIYDDNDNQLDDWQGYYAEPGTSMISGASNPKWNDLSDGLNVDAANYWGSAAVTAASSLIDSSTGDFKTVVDVEKINDSTIKSLRLYALAKTQTGILMFLSNVLYLFGKLFAWLATLIIGLIVAAKNINMNDIMDILNLDSLNDSLTKNFIYNSDNGQLSAFAGFCIVILIISITGFAIRWVKGSDKTTGLWEILGTVFIGLFIIGMCLTGRISSLGSSVADMASQVMYAAVNALTSPTDGYAFAIDIRDPENETKVVQLCEMAMVNKAFIDLQLCTQFGVADVDELSFANLNDSDGSIAKKTLYGVNGYGSGYNPVRAAGVPSYGIKMNENFNNNLGYYFWYANSSATKKTKYNGIPPVTSTSAVYYKLNSMITYLQNRYDSTSDATVRKRIVGIVESLAAPNGAAGFIKMLLFTVALVLMALVLLKYALNVIIAKLELFIALLGLAIAGPLILTSNKKLVETGKGIVGMLVVAFLECTVYSVIFDIIIYVVSTMFAPNVLRLLATIAFLLLLLKFNPLIAEKVKGLLDKTAQKMSPAMVRNKQALKNYARRKTNEAITNYNNSDKIVGYNADGTAIRQSRNGDALSKLMQQGANAAFSNASDRKGFFKINRDANKTHAKAVEDSNERKLKAAEAAIKQEMDAVENEAEFEEHVMDSEIDQAIADTRETDINGDVIEGKFNEENLSDEEKEHNDHLKELENDIEEIRKNDRYQELLLESIEIEKLNAERGENEPEIVMDEKRAAELAAYQAKLGELKKLVEEEVKAIKDSIEERIVTNTFRKHGYEFDAESTEDRHEQAKKACRHKAQQEHKEELTEALQRKIDITSAQANDTKTAKLGNKNMKVDRNAVNNEAAARLQLTQLQMGGTMSSTEDALKATKELTDTIVAKYDGVTAHTQTDQKVKDAKAHVKETRRHSQERKEAKERLKDAKEARDEEIDEIKGEVSDLKKDTKRKFGGGGVVFDKNTVSEYVKAGVEDMTGISAKQVKESTRRATQGKGTPGPTDGKTDSTTETKTTGTDSYATKGRETPGPTAESSTGGGTYATQGRATPGPEDSKTAPQPEPQKQTQTQTQPQKKSQTKTDSQKTDTKQTTDNQQTKSDNQQKTDTQQKTTNGGAQQTRSTGPQPNNAGPQPKTDTQNQQQNQTNGGNAHQQNQQKASTATPQPQQQKSNAAPQPAKTAPQPAKTGPQPAQQQSAPQQNNAQNNASTATPQQSAPKPDPVAQATRNVQNQKAQQQAQQTAPQQTPVQPAKPVSNTAPQQNQQAAPQQTAPQPAKTAPQPQAAPQPAKTAPQPQAAPQPATDNQTQPQQSAPQPAPARANSAPQPAQQAPKQQQQASQPAKTAPQPAPQQSAPQQAVPQQSAPQPQQSAPQQSAPVRPDPVAQSTRNVQNNQSRNTAPQQSAPNPAPQPSAPQQSAPQQSAPVRPQSGPQPAPQQSAPQPAPARATAPQPAPARATAPQQSAPQPVPARATTPQQAAPARPEAPTRAEAPKSAPQPAQSNVQEAAARMNNAHQEAQTVDIPVHSKNDTKASYMQDEARKVQRDADQRFWSESPTGNANGSKPNGNDPK